MKKPHIDPDSENLIKPLYRKLDPSNVNSKPIFLKVVPKKIY